MPFTTENTTGYTDDQLAEALARWDADPSSDPSMRAEYVQHVDERILSAVDDSIATTGELVPTVVRESLARGGHVARG